MLLLEGAHVDIHLKSGLMIRGIVLSASLEIADIGKMPAIHRDGHLAEVFEVVHLDASEICAWGIIKKPD